MAGCPTSPITSADSVPPWERDRSRVAPPRVRVSSRRNPKKKPKIVVVKPPQKPPTAMTYREYMASKYWQRRRRKALKTANHQCEDCHTTERLEVHHLTYKRLGQELPGDLRVLCFACHSIKHENKYPSRDPVSVEFRKLVASF